MPKFVTIVFQHNRQSDVNTLENYARGLGAITTDKLTNPLQSNFRVGFLRDAPKDVVKAKERIVDPKVNFHTEMIFMTPPQRVNDLIKGARRIVRVKDHYVANQPFKE